MQYSAEKIEDLISSCENSEGFFFKYVAANDVGATGAHQAGFYMPTATWALFLEKAGIKGENQDVNIKIKWYEGQATDSRYIWYGQGTRSEYRLTRGLNFLNDDNVGDLLVLIRVGKSDYKGYLLSEADEIDAFLEAFNLLPTDAYKIIRHDSEVNLDTEDEIKLWIEKLKTEFPPSREVSEKARELLKNSVPEIVSYTADQQVEKMIEVEYKLFKALEIDRYANILTKGFKDLEELLKISKTIQNRRKSRAGMALENHLEFIMGDKKIPFSRNGKTEQNKKPDFIFPSIDSYHDNQYSKKNLRMLAVKTTCKDRWRQIINEADKIENKHLFTLQPSISKNQLNEMKKAGVTLVVPSRNIASFPEQHRSDILDLTTHLKKLEELYKKNKK